MSQNKITTISVLGYGWLDLSLGKYFLQEYDIKGSTTSSEKIPSWL